MAKKSGFVFFWTSSVCRYDIQENAHTTFSACRQKIDLTTKLTPLTDAWHFFFKEGGYLILKRWLFYLGLVFSVATDYDKMVICNSQDLAHGSSQEGQLCQFPKKVVYRFAKLSDEKKLRKDEQLLLRDQRGRSLSGVGIDSHPWHVSMTNFWSLAATQRRQNLSEPNNHFSSKNRQNCPSLSAPRNVATPQHVSGVN